MPSCRRDATQLRQVPRRVMPIGPRPCRFERSDGPPSLRIALKRMLGAGGALLPARGRRWPSLSEFSCRNAADIRCVQTKWGLRRCRTLGRELFDLLRRGRRDDCRRRSDGRGRDDPGRRLLAARSAPKVRSWRAPPTSAAAPKGTSSRRTSRISRRYATALAALPGHRATEFVPLW
jgi:hypothetical protein